MLSRQGPPLAVGDVNGDGLDDVFIGGAAGVPGKLFIQRKDGSFVESTQGQPWEADKAYEDWGALFFDANGDGLPDLYVASGGYQLAPSSPLLQDRLYINKGGGRFVQGASGAAGDADQHRGCARRRFHRRWPAGSVRRWSPDPAQLSSAREELSPAQRRRPFHRCHRRGRAGAGPSRRHDHRCGLGRFRWRRSPRSRHRRRMDAHPVLSQRWQAASQRHAVDAPAASARLVVQPRRGRLRQRRSSRPGGWQSRVELHLHDVEGEQVRRLRGPFHRGPDHRHRSHQGDRRHRISRSPAWRHSAGDLHAWRAIPDVWVIRRSVHHSGCSAPRSCSRRSTIRPTRSPASICTTMEADISPRPRCPTWRKSRRSRASSPTTWTATAISIWSWRATCTTPSQIRRGPTRATGFG